MTKLGVESEAITRARDLLDTAVRTGRAPSDRETDDIERAMEATRDPAERQVLADLATQFEELRLQHLNNTIRPGDPETELRATFAAARVRRLLLVHR